MGPCTVDGLIFLRYLGNELPGKELAEFRQHLRACDTCRVRLAEERALSLLLRLSRPLYAAPAGLRARVSGTLEKHVVTISEAASKGAVKVPECPVSRSLTIGAKSAGAGVKRNEPPMKRQPCAYFQGFRDRFRRR
jgi:hypothetical protein